MEYCRGIEKGESPAGMAKREKKLKKNWNFFEIGVILIALCGMFLPGLRAEDYDCNRKIAKLQAEIERLKKENAELRVTNGRLKASSQEEGSVLRKELIETLDKYSTQAGRLKRLEMSAAGTIETLEPVYMGAREMELEADLKQCAECIESFGSGADASEAGGSERAGDEERAAGETRGGSGEAGKLPDL